MRAAPVVDEALRPVQLCGWCAGCLQGFNVEIDGHLLVAFLAAQAMELALEEQDLGWIRVVLEQDIK